MAFVTRELDTRGLNGPSPILHTQHAITNLDCDDVLMVSASDPGLLAHLDAFCRRTGNKLLQHLEWDGEFTYFIGKDCSNDSATTETSTAASLGHHALSVSELSRFLESERPNQRNADDEVRRS